MATPSGVARGAGGDVCRPDVYIEGRVARRCRSPPTFNCHYLAGHCSDDGLSLSVPRCTPRRAGSTGLLKPDSDFRWGYSKGQIQAAMSTMRSHYGSNYQNQISTLCQSLLQSNGTQGSTGANPGSDQSDESSKGNDDLADLLDTRSAEGDGLERRARKQAATRHANARNKGKPHLKGSKAAQDERCHGRSRRRHWLRPRPVRPQELGRSRRQG
ncbi:hypothetical protein L1887_55216 [Cichorium endivia]|nr:hypothetical protein L1887_55216 [Cichorium endivia]